ncbi:Sucrase, partial [Brachionus plicatilis]
VYINIWKRFNLNNMEKKTLLILCGIATVAVIAIVVPVVSVVLTQTVMLKKSPLVKSPYLEEIKNLKLTVEYLADNVVHVKIVDADDDTRYEIPYKLNQIPLIDDKAKSKAKFEHTVDPNTNLFTFKILRRSTAEAIFDTSMGAFVFNNQFLQISTKLPSKHIFGFGENNHEKLAHDLDFRSWGMFARDNAPGWGDNRNNYGFQPVYYALENSTKSHMVLFYTSNAMEYLFNPTPSLTMRTIGGIFDLYFVIDDTPEDVFKTYHNLIGRPAFPPYWSFGFQICRWGYNNLDDVKDVVSRTRNIQLPQDVQYIDIEYMIGYRILTVNQLNFSGLSDFQKDLEKNGTKLVLIVDPGLVMERNNSLYVKGLEKDIYIKWPNNLQPYDKDNLGTNEMISWCWPNGKLMYPDYMNANTHDWWFEVIKEFVTNPVNGSDMNGIWIDMNEPSSFETNELKPWNWLYPEDDQDRYPFFSLKCPVNKLDDPPYRTKSAFSFDSDGQLNPKTRLSQKTLCMIGTHTFQGNKYYHYDVHNLYGHSQALATYDAFKKVKVNKRPFVLTRSNFVGTGKYSAHWLGDNDATWKHMKMSIIGAIEYNMFGIPMIGADICGFFISVQDAEMCTRWLQLGSFYTFSRNHNANGNLPKDPASFKNKTLEDSTRKALELRYQLLPYIYTLMYHVSQNGGTAIKALFFEFPEDFNTYEIDEQFLLGHILVSPVLQPGKTEVRAYFPRNAAWYDLRTGKELQEGVHILSAPIDYINIHLRGGIVVPTQELGVCLNTECARKNSFGLIVALDKNQKAKGTLFWDDGESEISSSNHYLANYEFDARSLKISVQKNYSGFYGFGQNFNSVNLDGNVVDSSNIENKDNVVTISNQKITLNQYHTIEFV